VGGIQPSAVVLTVTVRAVKHHGGIPDGRATGAQGRQAIAQGMANVRRHLGIVREFGLPCVVAVNHRPGDTEAEVKLVRQFALEAGAHAAEVSDGFARGGPGASALAEAVIDACRQPSGFHFLYPDDASIEDKIEAVARRIYGASELYYYPDAERRIAQFTANGLGELPVCMAKTHLSLSADPALLNAPENFSLPVRDVRAYTGAGWLVPLCGDIQQMPGLGATPAAHNVDVDETGRTIGLF
jgi:formate--tetrahydrofolate ligase